MENDKSDILYLFYRPTEPIYVPKGQNKVAFSIPPNYLSDRERKVATQLLAHFRPKAKKIVPVKEIAVQDLVDMSHLMRLERHEHFSIFIPAHQELSAELIRTFMKLKTYEDLLSVAVYCREQLNPELFIYALTVAILHRPDTKDLPVPPLTQIFPDKYIDGRFLARASREANIFPEDLRTPIDIPQTFTASHLDLEQRVAYWREDIGVNLHHWHWHLVYPHSGDVSIVKKDRRGELFYYMHSQIVARYNCERLCNQLDRVQRLINWREPITEAYFSKLNSTVASRTWPARPTGIMIRDINRPVGIQQDILHLDVQHMERWRDRIFGAIHRGSVINKNNENIPLNEKTGIDVLGNIVEASILSINSNVYGNLHNSGHTAISFAHDPDDRYLESYAVMGDGATAMRDPIFYRWHAFVENIFLEYKNTLPPYTREQLSFEGIVVDEISLTTNNQRNMLNTFWSKSHVDLSGGLDFVEGGIAPVTFTHLNHADFSYTIIANNGKSTPQKGTVRIFIAPKEDERQVPLPFKEQKNLMIEMDKFTVTLRPGENTIQRKSSESSVTIPFDQIFPPLKKQGSGGIYAPNQPVFCGCGWPQYMLVPKGTMEGYHMDLFIMISDFNGDVVEQDEHSICNKAAPSYCGVRDKKYPDARAMGYPFDRQAFEHTKPVTDFITPKEARALKDFLTGNMKTVEITVKFTNN